MRNLSYNGNQQMYVDPPKDNHANCNVYKDNKIPNIGIINVTSNGRNYIAIFQLTNLSKATAARVFTDALTTTACKYGTALQSIGPNHHSEKERQQ